MILRNPEAKFACRSRPGEFRGYADHIGFFQHAGFVRGNPAGAAMGSSTYLPITTIDANELKTSSGERPYGELAEEKALHMARVLTQTDTGASFHTIAYAIREMLRNSIEHSFSDEVVMLAQFWPFKNQAEIAIYDGGIGVRNSLSDTEETDAISDEDAITRALKPGVTGVSEAVRAHQHKDYRNSGFGLYVTSKLCAENGFFRLISGNAGVNRNSSGDTFYNWPFDGTCVQMRINTSSISDANALIDQIVAEGEAEAKIEGRDVKASGSSKSVISGGSS